MASKIFLLVILFLGVGAFGYEIPKPIDNRPCTANIKDVISDCAEEQARQACSDNPEFDQCVGNKTSKFKATCTKNGAFSWCHRCKFKPPGCPIMKTQKHKKKHIQLLPMPHHQPPPNKKGF